MSFLDQAKKHLGDAVDKHRDKINGGLDKAGHAIDTKTGGKHSNKIRTGVSRAKVALSDFDSRRGDRRATSGGSQPPEPSADPPGGPSTDPSGPTGPSDPAEPTKPSEPTAPTGPMSGGGDPDPVPTDPSPVPPEPGADPNEEIATGGRPAPAPAGGAGE